MRRISYRAPSTGGIRERLAGVLEAVYPVFNEGYLASAGDDPLRADLTDEAVRLGRLLRCNWRCPPTQTHLVCGRRLDGSGAVGIGAGPSEHRLLERPGPDVNVGGGYRASIAYIGGKHPGCHGSQINGTTFSRTVTSAIVRSSTP